MKIFSNQRPSSVLVVKRSFGIREPPVPLFNILQSETRRFLISTFWNQRTASSYFQHFGIREPPVPISTFCIPETRRFFISTFLESETRRLFTNPRRVGGGLGFLQCCPAEYRKMKLITSGSQLHTTMGFQKQVKYNLLYNCPSFDYYFLKTARSLKTLEPSVTR